MFIQVYADDMCNKGCKLPVVVKFADTQRDKDMKRFQAQRVAEMTATPGLLGMQAPTVSSCCLLYLKFDHSCFYAIISYRTWCHRYYVLLCRHSNRLLYASCLPVISTCAAKLRIKP